MELPITKDFGLLLAQLQAGLHLLEQHPAGAVLCGLGLLSLAVAALRAAAGALAFIFASFLRPAKNLRLYGSWAVVTGATDGIGKAYCEELAKKGLNILLISRTESKLQACAAELQQRFGVQARVCAADLTKPDAATLGRIAAALEGLEVGILVNNAGLSYDHPEYLNEVDEAVLTDILAINALAPTLLAKLVLGGMRERGCGVIINVGSGVATVLPSSPLLSAYAGSKAYIDCFSCSMDAEMRQFGIRVQNQAPMFVATKMSKIRRASLHAPSPQQWARAAVRQIGYETSSSPFWYHGLQCALIRTVPSWVVDGHVMRMHLAFRAAYYRRVARRDREAAAAALAGAGGGALAAGEGAEGSPTKRELRRRK